MTEREKNLVVTLWQSGEAIEKIIRLLPYKEGVSRRYVKELRDNGVLTQENRGKRTAKVKVLELYNNGMTNPYEISEESGYSISTVRSVLARLKLNRSRPKHNYKRRERARYDKLCENSKRIVNLLEQGKSCAEVARLLGCTRQNVFITKKRFFPENIKKNKGDSV